MSELSVAAQEIGVPERTLRRAARRGTLRLRRVGARRVELDADERRYLAEHWSVIRAVGEALRTERNVRLAVLFGSVARGEAGEHSDVDVMVAVADERPLYLQYIAVRLQQALDREVDVASLDRLRRRSPALLGEVLRDGRVVVDRDGMWSALRDEAPGIALRGARERSADRHRAAAAIADLLEP
jgi:predicted nucleotidyltransferase